MRHLAALRYILTLRLPCPRQHLETYHAEGDSPFVAKGEERRAKSEEPEGQYADCPIDGCTETVLVEEMDEHVEFHAQEADLHEAGRPSSSSAARPELLAPEFAEPAPNAEADRHRQQQQQRPYDRVSSRQAHSIQSWRHIFGIGTPTPKTKHQGRRHPSPPPPPSSSASTSLAGSIRKRLGKAELGKFAHERQMPDWLVELLRRDWGVKGSGKCLRRGKGSPPVLICSLTCV